MTVPASPPFPVGLDLSDNNAYSVLTLALTDYAQRTRADALEEEEVERPNQHQVDYLNSMADTAERLVADVERQLDEAGKANS